MRYKKRGMIMDLKCLCGWESFGWNKVWYVKNLVRHIWVAHIRGGVKWLINIVKAGSL